MGCAEGEFVPSEAFEGFRQSVAPQPQDDPDYKIWNGLSLEMDEGKRVECVDVVLHAVDFGDHIEMFIDALGISDPPYGDLFPQHVAAYQGQFSEND
jgi:hypothetical protein